MKQHVVEPGLMLSTNLCLLENFLGPDYMESKIIQNSFQAMENV
jgi:hypothetical protein